MKKRHRSVAAHHDRVSEHAHALVAATGHIADEKVTQARNKLSELLEDAKESLEYVEDLAVDRARQADTYIREKPYQAVGIAIGIGALIGFCVARRK